MKKDAWDALKPWERYRLRVEAVGRTWTDPLFCLESAASVLGAPVFGEPRWIHLLNPGGASWREGDVVVHGTGDERLTSMVGGMTVASLHDTMLDLCRVLPPAFALAVADHVARRSRSSDSGPLSERGRAQKNRRGVRQLDWIDQHLDPAAESVGESCSRAVIHWLGYEAPLTQVTFTYEDVVDRVDFYFEHRRIIGESDGYGKYDATDAEASKQHFIAEKKREDRLRRYEGGFSRWDWKDTLAWRPLDRALRAAGLSPIRPADARGLASLATNPRSFPRSRDKA
ncbi:hypothetical protein ACH3VR_11320 [Microbacterium sp. B2969]|uniref:Uncharacterized protein n=1 Tax=Microbacterium alkaliflavum TaxID=3248839 RepID=A0ABW7Q7W8_9MICO